MEKTSTSTNYMHENNELCISRTKTAKKIASCMFPNLSVFIETLFFFSTSKVTLPGIEEAWTGLRMGEVGLKFELAYVSQYDIFS